MFALGGGVVAAGCSHRPVDYGGVAVLEGSVRRASRASAAIERGAAAVAIIETDVARGMGFVIDPAGYLLTNRHVIEDADHIEGVVFPARDPSRVYGSVRVVYIDPERDLALLHVHSNEPLTAVPLATDGFGPVSSYLADADPVVLLQREPGQGDQPQSLQLQHGEVSRLEVEYPAAGPGPFVGVTADVRQGQSGGPVLDRHGRAVGIVTWTWRRGGGGFAIPIDDATRMLEQRPQLELEADRRSRARLRARLFLDAIARGDGSTARRFTSPSQARKRRGQTVDEIMGNAQQGRGLQVMQGYVAALEEVVAKVVEAEDPQLAAVGLDVLVRGVIEAPFRDALGVRGSLEIGQVISFFHELGEGYLHARVYGGQGSEDALRSALQRLQTIDASRSFALAELAVALDERQAQVRSVELVPGAYIDGARIELELRGADGRTERVDLRLRLEWGDWYVASVEPSALG
ncbi:MAG: serine protease [Nannocystaceae bacterium]